MLQITQMGKEGHKLIKIIKLDPKGRLIIPKGVREKHGDNFILSEYKGLLVLSAVLV